MSKDYNTAAVAAHEQRRLSLLFSESEYARQEALAMFPLEILHAAKSLETIVRDRRSMNLGQILDEADECARMLEKQIVDHLFTRLGLEFPAKTENLHGNSPDVTVHKRR